MINIEEIKSYIPKNKLDLTKKYKKLKKNFLIKKIGTTKVSRKYLDEDVVDMCVKAFNKIKISKNKKINNLKVLILCTQNPERNGLPHNSVIIHKKLKLNNNVATFDVSQGCAGFIYCLKICENFLLDKEDQALIFTCDPYSKIISKGDKNTELLFGDAATVTLVNNKKNGQIVHDYNFFTNSDEFEAINNFNGKLKMNGKNVLSFAINNVQEQIQNIISKNKLKLNDIDKIYLHQGSKFILESLTKILKLNKKKIPIKIKNIGNTVSSSLPILLEKTKFKKNKISILCGFGVGLSISTCIIKKYEK